MFTHTCECEHTNATKLMQDLEDSFSVLDAEVRSQVPCGSLVPSAALEGFSREDLPAPFIDLPRMG